MTNGRAVVLAAFLALWGVVSCAAADAPTASGIGKIHHLIWIIRENHTFENYFGTNPGADGFAPTTCLPKLLGSRSCVEPFHMPEGDAPCDMSHEWERLHQPVS